MKTILIRKDNKNEVRVAEMEMEFLGDMYLISRKTGLLNGLMTDQPLITISNGKASRTMQQQALLEYNSMLRDYMSKGYKIVDDTGKYSISTIPASALQSIMSSVPTDANGILKPMLAKIAYAPTDKRYNDKQYSSFKINGVRCMIGYYAPEKRLYSASRGGKNYDSALQHILNNETLIRLFEQNENLILDGEVYIHGQDLHYISGLSRRMYITDDETTKLDFYIFDVVNDEIFNNRLSTLKRVEETLRNIADDLHDSFILDKIKFVEHEETYSYEDVNEMHIRAIVEGYEGLVLRQPNAKYGHNSRDWRMIKVKEYDDDEFTIIGKKSGLRSEDMCFTLVTKAGQVFDAKPDGPRERREYYDTFGDQFINRKANVRFFGYTPAGKPFQPVLHAIW